MLERFIGDHGGRLLTEALSRQSIVQGSAVIAAALSECCELSAVEPGRVLLEQGATDNHLCFILAGSFAILVNGREVAQRRAEQHVGEMALIDPKGRRAATVIALEDSVVARVSEPDFAAVANDNPSLWKNIACELAERLRQRNKLVKQRNTVPRVFVGSSRESLAVAEAIQSGLAGDSFIVTIWAHGVFGPSDFTIEALERVAFESDFAVLVLGPEDRTITRGHEYPSPRDNVILELGLFIGAVGRRRVFLLLPEEADVKIPTDVLGVTPVRYSTEGSIELATQLGPACSELRSAISSLGPR